MGPSIPPMSARTRHLPRRSCHSVPASSERFVAKAPGLAADMVFFDLEDSVAPRDKEAARGRVVEAIRSQAWGERIVGVRINGWASRWTYGDIIEVVGHAGVRLDEVIVPKVEAAAHVKAVDLLLAQVELNAGLPSGHLGIEAQIETAGGLSNVEEICAASPRLEAVTVGPVDLSASMGMPMPAVDSARPPYLGDPFHYVFMKILLAGRTHGLQVIDGPYVKVRDGEGLRADCIRTQILGYDGKWSVHPDQIPVLNELFAPTPEEFDRAVGALDLHAASTAGQDRRGAFMSGDEMVDEASRQVAVMLVARGERAGLIRAGNRSR